VSYQRYKESLIRGGLDPITNTIDVKLPSH